MPETKPRPSKRKRREPPKLQPSPTKKDHESEPYPDHARPTQEECLAVRDRLLALHGFPKQFAKYRDRRMLLLEDGVPQHSDEESVLDGLVKTVISQNTTEVNSDKAFACLKSTFPTWQDVLAAEAKSVENAIRCGGLAPTKAACIKNVLRCLMERRGELCLEYLRELSVDEIKTELSDFKGIGPKTVACVLLFNLRQDDFPVDTHVFEIAKTIGWVPMAADRLKTYLHLNRRIPKELKFDLNCLIYTHGKLCNRCSKRRDQQKGKESGNNDCPLLCWSKKNALNDLSYHYYKKVMSPAYSYFRRLEMEEGRSHVLVVTYPAQGHINPLLQFTKRLASKGVKVTFATTCYTIQSIEVMNVGVESISDGYDDGGFNLAPSAEDYVKSFQEAGSRTLSELVVRFKDSGNPVKCIVYDSLLPWAIDVARTFRILAAVFLTNSASVCSLYWHIHCNGMKLPLAPEALPLMVPGVPPIDYTDLPSFLADPDSQSAYLAMIMEEFTLLEQNDWVFCNSFEELETEVVKAMFGNWPLKLIGPAVPSAYLDQHIREDTTYGASLCETTANQCSRWLDRNLPNTVIYLSFGSMGNIPQNQVEELAWGLISCDRPFLWVLKDFESKLPSQVLAIGQKALFVEWCNQLEVLDHPSTCCFITHCGWNSTLEALSLGVPMVGMPLWSDQPTNAMFLEVVWKVGVRAQKCERGFVTRHEIEACINQVMSGEQSKEFKKNAMKLRELAKNAVSKGGSSDSNINEFVAKIGNIEDEP